VSTAADELARAMPATRRSMRHRWTAALTLLACAVVLLITAAVLGRADAQRVALQRTGTQAPGTVMATDLVPTGRTGFTDGSVQVQFDATGQGQPTPELIWIYVGGAVSGYKTGQAVTVVYDPANPASAQVLGVTTQQGMPFAIPLFVGVLLLVMAAATIRHAARIARVLRAEPWESVTSEVTALTAKGAIPRVVADLQTSKGHRRVSAVGLSRIDESFTPLALVAGVDAKLTVLANSDGSRVVGSRGPRQRSKAKPTAKVAPGSNPSPGGGGKAD